MSRDRCHGPHDRSTVRHPAMTQRSDPASMMPLVLLVGGLLLARLLDDGLKLRPFWWHVVIRPPQQLAGGRCGRLRRDALRRLQRPQLRLLVRRTRSSSPSSRSGSRRLHRSRTSSSSPSSRSGSRRLHRSRTSSSSPSSRSGSQRLHRSPAPGAAATAAAAHAGAGATVTQAAPRH